MKTLCIRSLATTLILGSIAGHVVAAENGGGAFCPFEVPEQEAGKHRFINLAIVQYVDVSKDELKIVYGGGALGSGYEIKVPLSKPDDAKDFLDHMRKTAAQCR
ncbi:MAG TPA: hypothetical protein VL381_00805 [Rhodocyclaceae bacterium]|jgi:hypothetical protein|nr:hypothetical protein [Rhodocyclaceae bacterium]